MILTHCLICFVNCQGNVRGEKLSVCSSVLFGFKCGTYTIKQEYLHVSLGVGISDLPQIPYNFELLYYCGIM